MPLPRVSPGLPGPPRRPSALALVALLMACGSGPPASDAGPPDAADTLDDPTLEFGTGQLDWEPVAPQGTPLELIHGPQGGYHLFGRLRSARLPGAVEVRFRVTTLTSPEALNNPDERITLRLGRGLRPAPDQGWETSGPLLLVLESVRDPAAVVGRTLRVEALVRPLDETRAARVTRDIVVVDDT